MSYTYDSLVADVIANMEEDSDEFLAALPSIIQRAQEYIQRRSDPVEILKSAVVTAVSRETILPADVLVVKSVVAEVSSQSTPLLQQTNEFLTAYWPAYTSVGVPKYYAAKDNVSIFLAPTPTGATPLTVEYVAKLPILSSAATTNWFSQNMSSAFFMSAMMFANLWTKNSSGYAVWKALTDEELGAINNTARRARRDDSSDRNSGAPENNLAAGAR